jgi:solute:Na+ symporter, SSS family
MTMAQYFEMRYSLRLRVFMGMLAFIAGVINYGIFPIVSARFFIYFLGLPTHFQLGPECMSFRRYI